VKVRPEARRGDVSALRDAIDADELPATGKLWKSGKGDIGRPPHFLVARSPFSEPRFPGTESRGTSRPAAGEGDAILARSVTLAGLLGNAS
jgi:hypothetical protein